MADDLNLILEDETELELTSDVYDGLELEDSYPTSDHHTSYNGPYDVTPILYNEQEFLTNQKLMLNNMKVREIPIAETTNLHGGRTVVIG